MATTTPHKNLLLLVIYDPCHDLVVSINKDREILRNYVESLGEDYDVEYKELASTSIRKYSDITALCQKKTRIVVWYTGHGQFLDKRCTTQYARYQCFKGDKIFIEQHYILSSLNCLPDARLRVVIFDCSTQFDTEQRKDDVGNQDNFSSLFDFTGSLLVASSDCRRSSRGSTFLLDFLLEFTSYNNTLYKLSRRCQHDGQAQYDKYFK